MMVIFIDSENQRISIKRIEESNDHEILIELQKMVAGYVEAIPFRNGDCLYVNDEGRLRYSHGFRINGFPMFGNGIIVGTDNEGNSIEAKTKIDEISVVFF